MRIVLDFRAPDPFVEVEGVRKPMSEFPSLKVTRLDGEEIPKLREVNTITNRLKRAVMTPGLQIEREEECTYLRISGLQSLDIVITGHDPNYGKGRPAGTVDRPLAGGPDASAGSGVEPEGA